MANEEPRDASQDDWGTGDEFALHLGWPDAGDRGPAPGSVQVVDQWGTPWGDATSDDADRPRTAPWEPPSPDDDRPDLDGLGARSVDPLTEVTELLEQVRSELGALRAEVVALKRRTALRADQGTRRSEEEADEIARLVAEHLTARPSKRSSRR